MQNSVANNPKYMGKSKFEYVVRRSTALAASTSGTLSFSTDTDSDFVWCKATYYVSTADDGLAAATRPWPGISILITDNSSGRKMANERVPLTAIFGTGELPYILPVETIIRARSTIVIDVANDTDNTSYLPIVLVFAGYKAYLNG